MNSLIIVLALFSYFVVLFLISWVTGKGSTHATFFTGDKRSPWFLVAFGMIGASLSGITFISIPGWVGSSQFSYFQMVLGYLVGYLIIGTVLLPLYYRLNVTSIYTYLGQRFGNHSYKTGAAFFLFSRIIGASFRLYLVAMVLHEFIFKNWGIPFFLVIIITIAFIWVYTFKSGIKTIVWTDSLQTLFMLTSVVLSIFIISSELDWSLSQTFIRISDSSYSQIFFWEWKDGKYFFKQFFAGASIAVVMTGLDQDMMQKNLSCKNLKDAQKNMFWFSLILVIVNLMFLGLGALLYMYSSEKGISIPAQTDHLFPMLSLNHFPQITGIIFILGLVAAAYSSADSALTSLTTSVCVDFLKFGEKQVPNRVRYSVHIGMSVILIFTIFIFKHINDEAVISQLFKVAGYTYGPLLGLFSFGLLTKWNVYDKIIPIICILSPILTYIVNGYSQTIFFGYQFGFELLILNGVFTFLGLFLARKK